MPDYHVTVNEAYYDKPLRYEKIDWSTLYDDIITMSEAYFNKLKEQTTWIPVRDRLPEMYVNVLVYTECKNTFIVSMVSIDGTEKWEDDYGYYLDEVVTHWRPLPEPPKE